MAFELAALAVILAVAAAAPQSHPSVPEHAESVKAVDADYDANPEYSFAYQVHEEHLGDVKSHQETRHGDVVEGSYSLIEADGTRRVVEYKADEQSGFKAVVRTEGVPQTPAVISKYLTAPDAPVGHVSHNDVPSHERQH